MSATSSVVSTAPLVDIPQLNLKHRTKKHVEKIRNIITKGNPFGIEKHTLVLEISTKQFDLTAEEKHQVNQQITFFFDKNKEAWLNLFFTGGQILANKIL